MDKQALLKSVRTRKHDSLSILTGIVDNYARANKDRKAFRVAGALRARDIKSALQYAEPDPPQMYGSAREYFLASQLSHFVRKVPFSDFAGEASLNAWKRFLSSEHRCRRVNTKLRVSRRVGREKHSAAIQRARDWITSTIGQEPNYEKIFAMCDFGPGASIGVHGPDTSFVRKIEGDIWTCTPTALPFARAAFWANAQLRDYLLPSRGAVVCYDRDSFTESFSNRIELVDHNKITMVPKTATVHRTIAIEPLLNSFVQKGVDNFLRGRLLRRGIDLSDQTKNQRLARLGSLGGFDPLVTIDLSSASDSISVEVAKLLLPPSWFSFLNAIRSPSFRFEGGSSIRYEKFCSMGNGFCFPLETLIFASIVHSVYEETGYSTYAVYGDDIIVHQGAALLIIEILNYLGFRTNNDKTFLFGPFRESCGADWFSGVNVRPYVLDFLPISDRDLIKIHNGLAQATHFTDEREFVILYLRKFLLKYPAKPLGSTNAIDDSVSLPLDLFMSHWSAIWSRHEHRWSFWRFVDKAVPRSPARHSSIQMYGLLRGSCSSEQGLPEVTLRRRTRTQLLLS